MKIADRYLVVAAFAFAVLIVAGCGEDGKPVRKDTLFALLSPEESGVDFVNRIAPDERINILTYEYLYNGGGVGIGDFNNDGFQDVFLAASQLPGKLFINKGVREDLKGGFSFEDKTEGSGITGDENWTFGVAVVDVNQDGWQDIYLNKGGPGNMNTFPNRLYVHQGLSSKGQPVFKEMAHEYGLDDRGQSIHALFFDYDRDGDLDMYQLTGGGFERSPNNPNPILTNGSAVNTDRLYRNDYHAELKHPVFTNVSREAGIQTEGYGLGVALADINEDGWPDVYVTNDYLTNDHLYINNRDGTFSDKISEYFKHTSHFAMGNDVGDINNDGLLDVIAMDMLPDQHYRRKLMFGATQYNKFHYAVNHGYTYQYMRNTLQLNNGNGSFSEIGQLAGIYKTDWSWAVLLADLDNDEFNDVFITNGFGKDVTDLDFVKFRSSMTAEVSDEALRRKILLDSLAQRPGISVSNYAYRNNRDLTFTDVSNDWGFGTPAYSNGAAYADFDNDGDLDIVVSNIDEQAFVYQNTQREKSPEANFLRLKLAGSGSNRSAIGSKVTIRYGGKVQSKINSVVRGFQSTMEENLHFGLGPNTSIDTLEVVWPDGNMTVLADVAANRLLHVPDSGAVPRTLVRRSARPIFSRANPKVVSHVHEENHFVDFNHEPLLPHKLSQEGPGLAVGDANGDGLDDFFIGGALLSSGKLFFQREDGTFRAEELGRAERESEDMGSLFFDADNDGDLDLYVVSGGNEYNPDHRHYQDRLYFNDGRGNFSLDVSALPPIGASGSCVIGADYDHDGDLDLFVGGRVLPTAYPTAPRSYLLRNDGKGRFADVTAEVAPELLSPGMVTGALWSDIDNDTWHDLVLVGEYMPITIFKNSDGKRLVRHADNGLADSEGWWRSVTSGDFDNDGDMDYIAGNFGLNTHYRASPAEPLNVSFKDFDNNGALEAITSYYTEGVNYPTASLDVLTAQLPALKRKILFHRTYAATSTDRLLEIAGKEGVKVLNCKRLESSYVENLGNGKFKISALPTRMQIAPVYGILTEDVNDDGNLDFLAVGNSYAPDVVSGRCDAFTGEVMVGDGKGNFKPMPLTHTGFFVQGDAKGIVNIDVDGKRLTMVAQNNDSLVAFRSTHLGSSISLHKMEAGLIMTEKDGKSRRVEVGFGSTYLSQSSRTVRFHPRVSAIKVYDWNGRITRFFEVRNGALQLKNK